MHPAAFRYVVEQLASRDLDDVTVLDIGGRDVNGTPRPLFPSTARYVVVDIRPCQSVDIVADAAELDLGEQFDIVLSTEVLEHAERAADIVAAAAKHTKPGGLFVATMAGPGRHEHGSDGGCLAAGEFYRNVSPELLGSWLEAAGFKQWEIDQAADDVRCHATAGPARKKRARS
jgi:SAM-dependent methyltransferase